MNFFYRIYYALAICIVIFIVFVAAVTISLNTSWGKRQVSTLLKKSAENQDMDFQFQDLKGFLPFQFKLTNVTVQIDNERSIQIGYVKFRISFLKLFKKTLSFRELYAENIHFLGFTNNFEAPQNILEYPLPFSLQCKNMELRDVHIPTIEYGINVKGKLRIEKNLDYLSMRLSFARENFSQSAISLNLKAEKRRLVQLNIEAKIQDAEALEPYLDLPIDRKAKIMLYASGPWQSFEKFFVENPSQSVEPIEGNFRISFDQLNLTTGDMSFFKNVKIHGNLLVDSEKNLFLHDVIFFNENFAIKGDYQFTSLTSFQKAKSIFTIVRPPENTLVTFEEPIAGNLDITKQNNAYLVNVTSNPAKISLEDFALEDTRISFQGQIENKAFDGALTLNSHHLSSELQLSTHVIQEENRLLLQDIQLQSDFLQARGNLAFYSLKELTGEMKVDSSNLSMVGAFYPNFFVEGSMSADICIDTYEQNTLDCSFDVQNFRYSALQISTGNFSISIDDPLNDPLMEIKANLGSSKIYNTIFSELSFYTDTEEENWPFEIRSIGSTLDISANGFWRLSQNDLDINLQELSGVAMNRSFFLEEPVSINWRQNVSFQLSEFTLSMEDASLGGDVSLDQDLAEINLSARNFPIETLSLNTMELSMQGEITGELNYSQNRRQANGDFRFVTQNTRLYTPGDSQELQGTGSIAGSFQNKKIEFTADFRSNGEAILQLDATLPLVITPTPFNISLLENDPIQANISYNARAEDLLDFFDLGFNFLQGDLECNLTLEGTPSYPLITGTCELTDGIYENYLSGTHLTNIHAQILARGNHLELIRLTASGPNGGQLSADGELNLNLQEYFPYTLHTNLENIRFVQLDSFQAAVDGEMTLQGNIRQATATADVTVTQAEFSIPERIASSIPSLAVTYVNAPKDFAPTTQKDSFQLFLNIHAQADEKVFVRGRGLTAELQGDITLRGSLDDVQTIGRLDLIRGDLLFGGHSFDLTQGELIFTEGAVMPFITISAQTTIQGITISATLSGQLNRPDLEFRSLPPLPLSSILSYLLFGSDISEISALQAVTIASTAINLTGGGAYILEATRKSLGLDRLAVVSTPSSSGEEDFAVQIGKYVARGVLISFTQGIEPGTTNVIIEVDLKHGFVFQAETLQQQEQGRFTLKWNRNF